MSTSSAWHNLFLFLIVCLTWSTAVKSSYGQFTASDVTALLGKCNIANSPADQYAAGLELVKHYKDFDRLRKAGQLTNEQLLAVAIEKKRFFIRLFDKTAKGMPAKELKVIINETGSHIGLQHGTAQGFRTGSASVDPSDFDFVIVGDDAKSFVNKVRETVHREIGSNNPDRDMGFAVSTLDKDAIKQLEIAYPEAAFKQNRILDSLRNGKYARFDNTKNQFIWDLDKAGPDYALYHSSLNETIEASQFFKTKVGKLLNETDLVNRAKLVQRALFTKQSVLKLSQEERNLYSAFSRLKSGSSVPDVLSGRLNLYRSLAHRMGEHSEDTVGLFIEGLTKSEQEIAKRIRNLGHGLGEEALQRCALGEFCDSANRVVAALPDDLRLYKKMSRGLLKSKTGSKLLHCHLGMAIPFASAVLAFKMDGWTAGIGCLLDLASEAIKKGSTTPALLLHVGRLATEIGGQAFLDEATSMKVKGDLKAIFGDGAGNIDVDKLQSCKTVPALKTMVGEEVRKPENAYRGWAANVESQEGTAIPTGTPRGSETFNQIVENKVFDAILPLWMNIKAVSIVEKALENCEKPSVEIIEYVDSQFEAGNIQGGHVDRQEFVSEMQYAVALHFRRKRLALAKAMLKAADKQAKDIAEEMRILEVKRLRREALDKDKEAEESSLTKATAWLKSLVGGKKKDDGLKDIKPNRFWLNSEEKRAKALALARERRLAKLAKIDEELTDIEPFKPKPIKKTKPTFRVIPKGSGRFPSPHHYDKGQAYWVYNIVFAPKSKTYRVTRGTYWLNEEIPKILTRDQAVIQLTTYEQTAKFLTDIGTKNGGQIPSGIMVRGISSRVKIER